MTLLAQFLRAQAQGTALLSDAAGLSERELLSSALARCKRGFAGIGAGVLRGDEVQENAAASALFAARLATLQLIEKYARMLRNQRDAWRLREELCTMTGSDSALRRRARSW